MPCPGSRNTGPNSEFRSRHAIATTVSASVSNVTTFDPSDPTSVTQVLTSRPGTTSSPGSNHSP